MKLFKATTKTVSTVTASEFADWYDADTLEDARAMWSEDCHRYGLLMDKTSVEFVECNPETLKPV